MSGQHSKPNALLYHFYKCLSAIFKNFLKCLPFLIIPQKDKINRNWITAQWLVAAFWALRLARLTGRLMSICLEYKDNPDNLVTTSGKHDNFLNVAVSLPYCPWKCMATHIPSRCQNSNWNPGEDVSQKYTKVRISFRSPNPKEWRGIWLRTQGSIILDEVAK